MYGILTAQLLLSMVICVVLRFVPWVTEFVQLKYVNSTHIQQMFYTVQSIKCSALLYMFTIQSSLYYCRGCDQFVDTSSTDRVPSSVANQLIPVGTICEFSA